MLAVILLVVFRAASAHASIKTVFVIAMENHNWTQPVPESTPQQILGNIAAPFLNSLVTPGNANAAPVSYASNYQSLGVSFHPSEPNYLYAEAGSAFGVTTDNDPYGLGGNAQATNSTLSQFLQNAGHTWKAYVEDANVDANNTPIRSSSWTVPLQTSTGTFNPGHTNAYNGSNIFALASKHIPMVFFSGAGGNGGTNGGNNTAPSNPLTPHYPPLQQLASDLASNNVAQYNWIVPDLDNDMHDALTGGFTHNGQTFTDDQAAVAQGDNFLSIIVPQIMASQAYKNGGAIIIWFDETEGGDSSSYTIPEIIISPLAKGNAYTNSTLYTHASDVKTMQEVFNVNSSCLGGACGATDLSDLFVAGAIP